MEHSIHKHQLFDAVVWTASLMFIVLLGVHEAHASEHRYDPGPVVYRDECGSVQRVAELHAGSVMVDRAPMGGARIDLSQLIAVRSARRLELAGAAASGSLGIGANAARPFYSMAISSGL